MTELTIREQALLNAATDPYTTCAYALNMLDYETGRRMTCQNGCWDEPVCTTSAESPSIGAFEDLTAHYVYRTMAAEIDHPHVSGPHPDFEKEFERLESKLYPEESK